MKKTLGTMVAAMVVVLLTGTFAMAEFVIAIASLLFFYIGFRIDQYFGTAPNFMFGMFFLAFFLTIGRLYQEAWLRRKEV